MKKISFYLATAMLLMLSVTSIKTNAQAFQKGNWNIDVDLGLGIYATESTSRIKAFGFVFEQTDKDATASSILRVGAEYGISNKFGLGIKLGTSNYFIDEEDKDTVKSVKSRDIAFLLNYHLLKSDKNDLFLSFALGGAFYSSEYQSDPAIFIESVKGSGSYFHLGITDRIFFSDNIGMLFTLNFTVISVLAEPELANTANNFLSGVDYIWELNTNLTGMYLGTGLAIKF